MSNSVKQFFLIPLFQHKDEVIKINKEKFTIGRSLDCDCYIHNDTISKVHATIVFENNDYFIIDNNSSNGTYVNDIKIGDKTKLKDGYTIMLSKLVFEVSTNLPEKVLFFEGNYKVVADDIKDKDVLVKYLLSEKELMDNISSMLLSRDNVETILSNMLDFAIKLLNADRGILLTKENGEFIPKVSSNLEDEFSSVNTLSKSIVDYVVCNKKPVLVNNPVFNERFTGKSLLQFQIESSLCSPIYIDDEIAAILYIDNREEKKQFTTFQYALFLSFISHCQNILFNARKNEKLLEDLMAQSVVNRWDEINRVKDNVVDKFNENIIKPLHILEEEINKLEDSDETLKKFKETYKSVVNNIDKLNIDVDIDKDMAILTTINLKNFIAEIVADISNYLELHQIKLDITGDDIIFETYKLQFSQVIKNLLLFLVKVLSKDSQINITTSQIKNNVQINISGCNTNTLNKTNDYFSRSDSKRMLEMCSNLLRGMGGTINNSVNDNCFVFQILFKENGLRSDDSSVKVQEKGKEQSVSVVLKDTLLQSATVEDLKNNGFKVFADVFSETPDVLIVEVNQDNYESYLKACSENCKVVAIVNQGEDIKFKKKLLQNNVFIILEKPVHNTKLLEVVKMVFRVTNAHKYKIKRMRTSIIRDLVATMKHEINNPLQIMAMNLEMIKTDENRERVEKIKDGAERIAKLINNLSSLNDFELVKYASSNRKIITPKEK